MANTLKLVTYTGSSLAADTDDNVYTVPSSTTTIIIGFTISNITTNNILVNVKLSDDSESQTVYFMKGVSIPSGSSLEIMAGNKLVMNTLDTIVMSCDTANGFDAVLSIVEQA